MQLRMHDIISKVANNLWTQKLSSSHCHQQKSQKTLLSFTDRLNMPRDIILLTVGTWSMHSSRGGWIGPYRVFFKTEKTAVVFWPIVATFLLFCKLCFFVFVFFCFSFLLFVTFCFSLRTLRLTGLDGNINDFQAVLFRPCRPTRNTTAVNC